MTNLSGKTIYLVKVGDTIIEKTLKIEEARETLADYNFPFECGDMPKGMKIAKLFKATIK